MHTRTHLLSSAVAVAVAVALALALFLSVSLFGEECEAASIAISVAFANELISFAVSPLVAGRLLRRKCTK